MAEDVRALLDHLGLAHGRRDGLLDGRAHHRVPGARASRAGAQAPCSAGSAVTWSTASGCPRASPRRSRRPRSPTSSDRTGRTFRAFAEQTRSDLAALAACIRGSRQTLSREQVAAIRVPVLVAVGSKDAVAGSAQELAALLPVGRALDIPGRDHMLAVGDRVFKEGVLAFLAERP